MDKRAFKSHVIDIILDAMKAHCNVNRYVETSMVSKNNGFYFKFHRHGEELQIIVFPEGNLGIKVREYRHADQFNSYYIFCQTDNHMELLEIIRSDLSLLIQDFYDGLSYASLADYQIHFTLLRTPSDWTETYRRARAVK